MSEEKEQAVSEETEAPVMPQEAEVVDTAQESDSDDFEKALSEFETKASPPATQQDYQSEDFATEFQHFRQEFEEERYRADMKKVVNEVRGDLDPDLIDDEFVDSWVNGMARKNPKLAQAWMDRRANPEGFNRVLKGLNKQFTKKYGKLSRVDAEATSAREAVAAAVKGTSGKAPEGKQADYSDKTNNEFRRLVRDEFGFDPGV